MNVNFRASRWWIVAGVAGALAVICGAFGAHWLEGVAPQWPTDTRARRLENWEVGVRYHTYHALALLGVATLASLRPTRLCHAAGGCFVLGVLIFSGCLYAYTLTGLKWLGMVVPIGGLLLIIGWCLLAATAMKIEAKIT